MCAAGFPSTACRNWTRPGKPGSGRSSNSAPKCSGCGPSPLEPRWATAIPMSRPIPLRLVTLNCGYADGYPRALANRAWAGFQGATYPVVGQVSMDSLTVAVPESVDIGPGDSMVLLSREPSDPHSVANTARLLGTIPYEVTCALNRRVLRIPA